MFGADGGAEDLHDEYLMATVKKAAGLPEHIKVAEMRLEYGVRDENGTDWWSYDGTYEDAERHAAEPGDKVLVREVVTTEAREATPRGE